MVHALPVGEINLAALKAYGGVLTDQWRKHIPQFQLDPFLSEKTQQECRIARYGAGLATLTRAQLVRWLRDEIKRQRKNLQKS